MNWRAAASPMCPSSRLGEFTPLQSFDFSEVATRLGANPMQAARAWLLYRAPNILLIPGNSSIAQLHENLAAAELALTERPSPSWRNSLKSSSASASRPCYGDQRRAKEERQCNVCSGHQRTMEGLYAGLIVLQLLDLLVVANGPAVIAKKLLGAAVAARWMAGLSLSTANHIL